jgi:serine/threonine-protein kinase
VYLVAQICDALAYAHDLGVIHRDVSPSNVIVSADGNAKLIDFGVAKTVTSNTSSGVIKGKFGYIAPEYIDGKLDRRADLWAAGVVAYELLTNRRLFDGDEVATLYDIKERVIEPPSHYNPDIPEELDAIVMTALEREPLRRWQNAAAMRNALRGLPHSRRAEVLEWVEWALAQTEPAVPPAPAPKSRLKTMTEVLLLTLKRPAVGAAMVARHLRARRRSRVLAALALAAGGAAGALVYFS